MGMSPFEVDLGWQPASPLDKLSKSTEPTVQCVSDFKPRLASSLDDAKFAMTIAQARQSA